MYLSLPESGSKFHRLGLSLKMRTPETAGGAHKRVPLLLT